MKYLFLDIDGVLNHEDWYEKTHKNPQPFPISSFDPDCVNRVNRILQETGARLVISSSWRYDSLLSNTLSKVGLPTDFDVTPCWKRGQEGFEDFNCRGDEVLAFLQKHPYEYYIIIDDDHDFYDFQNDNIVYTVGSIDSSKDAEQALLNGGTGLTEQLADLIIAKFKQHENDIF